MTKIRDALIEFNPWWKGEFELEYKDRDVYDQIRRFLPQPQILAFTGLRRAGKTTLMMKIISDKLKSGLDPKDIVYFSFDEFRKASIREILNEHSSITETTPGDRHCLLLLDEIQKVEGWDGQLKAAYDRYKKKMKIIISGSESLFIRQISRKTLAGRLYEFEVEPLTFREYLNFKGIRFRPVALYERELLRTLDEFVLTQGFPELVGITDKEILKKYVHESVLDRVVYKDLPGLTSVQDINLLRSLLNIIVEEPGQIVQLSDLAGQLGISRQTISNYLTYLEDSFLIRKLYNYSTSRRKVERKLKKYYPTVISVDLLFKDDDLSRSKVFEWMVVRQLKAEFFWRDSYKNEVDAVIFDKKPQPVEVKYGRQEFSGIKTFMKKFRSGTGYVITRDVEGMRKVDGNTINIVPAYRFLLNRKRTARR